jgi:integrase
VVKKPANARKPWVVRYRVDGRQREKAFATRKEADQFKTKTDHDARSHAYVDPDDKTTLTEFAEQWLPQHAVSEGSRRTYTSVWKTIIKPALGDKRLASITREDVTELLLSLTGKPSSARTARTLLSAMLGEAVARKRLASNPAKGIKLPAVKTQKAEFYMASREELELLAKGLPADWRLAVWLMRGCGLRPGEALGARYEDVRGKTLRVAGQRLQDGSRGPIEGRREGQYRDVPLPAYVAAMIQARGGPKTKGDIFPPGRTDVFRDRFMRAAKDAGLPAGYHPHALRHSWASAMLAKGVPLFEVSRFLGHKSADFTAEVYGHLVPSAFDRAMAALDDEWAA